jgi:hypothetical protein
MPSFEVVLSSNAFEPPVLFEVLKMANPVVRQIVVHHIKRISFSLAEVLRFGIAC